MENTIVGNKFSIVNLQTTIMEICKCLNEVMSRTGPIKFTSWKFPDQAAMDVDIESLLAKYTFFETDLQQSVLAHNCLLELLIDRLIVFIQAVSQYIEINLIRPRSEFLYTSSATSLRVSSQPNILNQTTNMVLANLWHSILQLQKIFTRIQSLQGSKASALSSSTGIGPDAPVKSSSAFPELKDSVELYTKQRRVSKQSHDGHSEEDKPFPGTFNVSSNTVSSSTMMLQTSSNALLEYLQDVGQQVMKTTKERGLPSSLENCSLQRLADSLVLSPGHLTEWCDDVSRDIQRITKYVGDLELQLHSLKEGTRQSGPRHDHLVASLHQENQELTKKEEALLAQIRSMELLRKTPMTQALEVEVERLQLLDAHQQEKMKEYEDELASLRTQWEIREMRYKNQIAELESRLNPSDVVQEGASSRVKKTTNTGVQADQRVMVHDDGDLEEGFHSQAMADAEMSRLRAQLEVAYGRIEELQQRMKVKEKLGYQNYRSQSSKTAEETVQQSVSKEHRPSTSEK